jgi:hypothetical protein
VLSGRDHSRFRSHRPRWVCEPRTHPDSVHAACRRPPLSMKRQETLEPSRKRDHATRMSALKAWMRHASFALLHTDPSRLHLRLIARQITPHILTEGLGRSGSGLDPHGFESSAHRGVFQRGIQGLVQARHHRSGRSRGRKPPTGGGAGAKRLPRAHVIIAEPAVSHHPRRSLYERLFGRTD